MARTIEVSHPAYGTYRAEGAADKLAAVQQAARAWGGLQWSRIARECSFREAPEPSGAARMDRSEGEKPKGPEGSLFQARVVGKPGVMDCGDPAEPKDPVGKGGARERGEACPQGGAGTADFAAAR